MAEGPRFGYIPVWMTPLGQALIKDLSERTLEVLVRDNEIPESIVDEGKVLMSRMADKRDENYADLNLVHPFHVYLNMGRVDGHLSAEKVLFDGIAPALIRQEIIAEHPTNPDHYIVTQKGREAYKVTAKMLGIKALTDKIIESIKRRAY